MEDTQNIRNRKETARKLNRSALFGILCRKDKQEFVEEKLYEYRRYR